MNLNVSIAQNNSNLISTVSIKDKTKIESIRKMAKYWAEHAAVRMYIAENNMRKEPFTKRELQLLSDSVNSLSTLKSKLKKNPKKIYIARDADGNVQGIAMVCLKNKNKIKLLATNPENLPIIGYEKVTAGVETGLMAHLFKKALKNTFGNKNVSFKVPPSAIEICEHIGFKASTPNQMSIQPSAMKAFVNTLPPGIITEKKEPKLSDLKYDQRNFQFGYKLSFGCKESIHISDIIAA